MPPNQWRVLDGRTSKTNPVGRKICALEDECDDLRVNEQRPAGIQMQLPLTSCCELMSPKECSDEERYKYNRKKSQNEDHGAEASQASLHLIRDRHNEACLSRCGAPRSYRRIRPIIRPLHSVHDVQHPLGNTYSGYQ